MQGASLLTQFLGNLNGELALAECLDALGNSDGGAEKEDSACSGMVEVREAAAAAVRAMAELSARQKELMEIAMLLGNAAHDAGELGAGAKLRLEESRPLLRDTAAKWGDAAESFAMVLHRATTRLLGSNAGPPADSPECPVVALQNGK